MPYRTHPEQTTTTVNQLELMAQLGIGQPSTTEDGQHA
jgi:hypothetical protein